MKKSNLNVALLGYGYAGKTFHAPLINATEGLHLTQIYSSNAAKVLRDLPLVSVTNHVDDILTNNEVDLVVIATPNNTHFELGKRALENGKHVVIDKPLATTVDEARKLVQIAKDCSRVLSVFQNRRWDSDFLTVQKVIASGELGKIVHFESHFDRYRPIVQQRWRESAAPGGGLWFDLGPHLLDQALTLFGEPETITVDFAQQRQDAIAVDYFHALLRYQEMRVILHAASLVPSGSARFIIHGTKGSFIKYGLDSQEAALLRGETPGSATWGGDINHGILTTASGPTTITSLPGNYLSYYEAIRDCILHKKANPIKAEDAISVMEIISRAHQDSQAIQTKENSLRK